MKKLFVLFICFAVALPALSQTFKETKLFKSPFNELYSLYDIRYDAGSGTWVYSYYDTVTQKYSLKSNKGSSGEYGYAGTYDLYFDKNGNYYASVYNVTDNETSDYSLIKNGAELRKFQSMGYSMTSKDDGLYFVARDKDKDYRVKYDYSSGSFDYGKSYDTIYLAFMNPEGIDPEPMYELGFTKDGKDFYIACDGGKQMVVVGNEELKKFDEIVYRAVYLDPLGNVYYVGREYKNRKNNYYLVHNGKEYGPYTDVSVYMVTFDKDNNPVFAASEEVAEYPTKQFVVKGTEKISDTFTQGVYDLIFSPSGLLAFTGTDTLPDGSYETAVFLDGREVGRYPSAYNLKFKKDNTLMYVASDKDYNSFVVDNGKVVSKNYSYISNLETTKDGELSYIGTIYGNYELNIPDKVIYVIGKTMFGPFSNLYMGEMGPSPVVFNDKNDFVFIATKREIVNGEEYYKQYVQHKNWASDTFDFVFDIISYKNDFYFAGGSENIDGSGVYKVYKNDIAIGDYNLVNEFKLDKDKGVLSFMALKKDFVYFIEVKL